jgi:CheY-like chemotaxis protein
VDDDAVREVTVEMLQGLGYRTLVAGRGQEAMDLLETTEPVDLLFTDQVMPGCMSGAELARQARTRRPGLPILLTTGYARGHDSEADGFPVIGKPFRRRSWPPPSPG